MTDEHARTVLLVDDEPAFRDRLARALAERGFDVRAAGSAEEALAIAAGDTPELAVVDLRLPGASGLQLVRELRAFDPTTRIVVLTGYGSIATALDAVRSGAAHYLTKPVELDALLDAFDRDAEPGAEPPPTEVPSLARVEREHIERVLAQVGGNVSEAARLLGLHRKSLQRKLSKFPVNR
jgi:two-component system response regulator RegA